MSIFKLFKLTWVVKPVASAVAFLAAIIWSVSPAIELLALKDLTVQLTHPENLNYYKVAMLITWYLGWALIIPNIASRIKGMLDSYVGKFVYERITTKTFEKASRIPYKYLETANTRDMLFRASSSQTFAAQKLLYTALSTGMGVVRALSVVGIIAAINPYIFIIVVAVSIPTLLIRHTLKKRMIQFRISITETERRLGTIGDILINSTMAAEVKMFGNRILLGTRWRKLQTEINKRRIRFETSQSVLSNISSFIQAIGRMLALSILLALTVKGKISTAEFISCMFGLQHLQGVINSILQSITDLVSDSVILDEFNKVMGWEEDAVGSEEKITEIPPEIEFKNVSYQYPNAKQYALRNVTFKITSGEKLVLVGKNGSGKSTIIRLLLGLDKPTEGSILYNGRDISECLDEVRQNVTTMFQDYAKYELAAKDNVIISDTIADKSEEVVDEMLDWTGVKGVIYRLKRGLETIMIKEANLSGGEWQRVAISRARYRERPMVVLDEPTAAVDAFHETEMYKKFIELFHNHTAVIVSHRLSIAALADKILVMDDGNLLEFGTHPELYDNIDGYYRKMYTLQAEMYAQETQEKVVV